MKLHVALIVRRLALNSLVVNLGSIDSANYSIHTAHLGANPKTHVPAAPRFETFENFQDFHRHSTNDGFGWITEGSMEPRVNVLNDR